MQMQFSTDRRQNQALSPRLQHAVRLLQMSSLDFAALVRDKLGSNPFLDIDEGTGDGTDAGGERHDARQAADGTGLDAGNFDAEAGPSGSPIDLVRVVPLAEPEGGADTLLGDDRDLWQLDARRSSPRPDHAADAALQAIAEETLLNEHLHAQLGAMPLTDRERLLARAIVESLDDDGYLRATLDELVRVLPLEPTASVAEMQAALHVVQQLEPAGVAARSVGECLRLQLPAITCPRMRGLAASIVEEKLDALAARDTKALAAHLNIDVAEVEAVCERIRHLDPRPGWRFSSTHVAYVVPDVIVKRVRGEWAVQLNPAVVPRVRLNQVYAELFQRHRADAHAELADHLQDARWTLRNMDLRFTTIVAVAEAIIKRQRHFLEFGAMAMKPLVLREIAEEVGIHESTVSRVTNNKYMATPMGVFELKFFFSRPMLSANGRECSGTAIRGLIKDIIEAESAQAPLSDAAITRQLAQQGLVVARRTVTKYRQMLKIEAVERRRRHG